MPARKPSASSNLWDLVLSSRAQTESLGRAIGRAAEGGEVLALIGELGAGKTALVRGIASGLAAPAGSVSSPTFVLVHEYVGRLCLVHMDLYRRRTESDAANLGLQDYFTDRSITAIEWADRFPDLLPPDRLEIELAHRTPVTRTSRVTARGPRSLRLLAGLKRGWHASRRRQTNKARSRKTSTR
jgi:tRNA threonylcarbamoyladenosine biosynthesis protein TsaE